jgi:hypothetical protein
MRAAVCGVGQAALMSSPKEGKYLMKKVVIALGLLALTATAASSQWQLGPSQYEPCWSIANPISCNPHVKPGALVNFQRDPAAAQSYWRNH